MKTHFLYSKTLLAFTAVAALAVPTIALWPSSAKAVAPPTHSQGVAVAYPWAFEKGNRTSRTMAVTTAEGILRKAGYSSIPGDIAKAAWTSNKLRQPSYGQLPSRASLKAFGTYLHATKVIYGTVSWRTRSIWVNAGPKTISTATVDVYVYDVRSGKVVYTKKNVEGRSDEKSNGYKIAADVLFTPLVTAVSGGPATPQEQRAVQIALGLAYHSWVRPAVASK